MIFLVSLVATDMFFMKLSWSTMVAKYNGPDNNVQIEKNDDLYYFSSVVPSAYFANRLLARSKTCSVSGHGHPPK